MIELSSVADIKNLAVRCPIEGQECLYVLRASDGLVKVGRTSRPRGRIGAFVDGVRAFSKGNFEHGWVTSPHYQAKSTEQLLIEYAISVSKSRAKREYFRDTKYDLIVERAEILARSASPTRNVGEAFQQEVDRLRSSSNYSAQDVNESIGLVAYLDESFPRVNFSFMCYPPESTGANAKLFLDTLYFKDGEERNLVRWGLDSERYVRDGASWRKIPRDLITAQVFRFFRFGRFLRDGEVYRLIESNSLFEEIADMVDVCTYVDEDYFYPAQQRLAEVRAVIRDWRH